MQLITDITDLYSANVDHATYTANGNSSSLDLHGSGAHVSSNFKLDATAVSGTTPSMAVQIQESPDNSTWTNLTEGGTITITAAGSYSFIGLRTFRYIRASYTVTGTTPSFAVNLDMIAQKNSSGGTGGYSRSPST